MENEKWDRTNPQVSQDWGDGMYSGTHASVRGTDGYSLEFSTAPWDCGWD